MTNYLYMIGTVVILASVSYFLVMDYPEMNDDFEFFHVAKARHVTDTGFTDVNDPLSGFYVIESVISQITSIPPDYIPRLPLLALPFILIMLSIMVNILDKNIGSASLSVLIIGLMTLYIMTGNIPNLKFFAHGVGFVVFLSTIYIVSEALYQNNLRPQLSIILIIYMIDLNYISYKMTVLSIAFLFSLQILSLIFNKLYNDNNVMKQNFAIIALIGIIYFFTFNFIIYNEFIPRAVDITQTGGIERMFLMSGFNISGQPEISKYYFQPPNTIAIMNSVLLATILLLGIIPAMLIEINKLIKRSEFTICEKIFFSVLMSTGWILLIYMPLGFSEITLLLFPAIFGYIVLFTTNSKKFVIIIVMILVIGNVILNTQYMQNDYKQGRKDWNNYQYINIPVTWYLENGFIKNQLTYRSVRSDVFTTGYIANEMERRNISYKDDIYFSLWHFMPMDIKFLIDHDENNILENDRFVKNRFIMINYKLKYFITEGWNKFKSWSDIGKGIRSNPYLNIVYSSGDIDIGILK